LNQKQKVSLFLFEIINNQNEKIDVKFYREEKQLISKTKNTNDEEEEEESLLIKKRRRRRRRSTKVKRKNV